MSRTFRRLPAFAILIVAALAAASGTPVQAQAPPTMAQFLSAPYPFELVAATRADRLAWLVLERGMRNVYTAAGPDYRPVRLTSFTADDGTDISDLAISDDGSVVVFARGHTTNREGWVANPTANPAGAERAFWAARTAGGGAWRLGEGTTPVLSPDGRSVLYAKDGQIYRYAVARTAPRRTASTADEKPLITARGSNASPRWSPDGTRVAFVSDRVDHSFIGIYDTRKRTVVFLGPGVDRDSNPTWSPDSRHVAFIRRPGLPFGQQAQQGTGGIGNPPGPAYVPGQPPGRGGQGRGGAAAAGRGAQSPDPTGKPPVPGLTSAAFGGGYTIAFWVGDAASGAAREVWHNAPDDKVFSNITAIQWAGDRLVFPSEPDEWIRYYSVPADGEGARPAEPVTLTPGEGMVEQVDLSRDGHTLFYSTNAGDIDRRHVWKVLTAGGDAVQVTAGESIETYPVAIGAGRQVAVLSADARRPQSIGLVASGGAVKVVYPALPRQFPLAQHVVPQNVMVKAPDGLEIHNQLFLPPGLKAGERRPAIVFVHGGPVRQMLLGYHYMWFYHLAYMMNQWLANQGYVVFSVNYRSGIGYGRSFRTAPNTGARGNAEYQDVLAAGKYLQTRSDVDPRRIGIWGLSYGGLLTAQALARNSDLFVAGVDLAGVHLYTSSLDPANVAYTSSAISAIDGWKSPVLLVHGDDDRNVAFTQTTGLVQLLRARGVPHEVIVFPDDVHESLLYSRWLYTFDRMEAFLTRYLKN